MKRFSKMFSVMMLVPSACVASAMYCACMSVGKPGYSSVIMSAHFSGPLPTMRTDSPLRLHRHAALFQLLQQRVEMKRIAAGDDAGRRRSARRRR